MPLLLYFLGLSRVQYNKYECVVQQFGTASEILPQHNQSVSPADHQVQKCTQAHSRPNVVRSLFVHPNMNIEPAAGFVCTYLLCMTPLDFFTFT